MHGENMKNLDNILSLTIRQHVSAVEQPSSGQIRTQSSYIESVHCMGFHIVYSGTKAVYTALIYHCKRYVIP